MLKHEQKQALLVECHKAIEESASHAVDRLEGKDDELTYPPNWGLSAAERDALNSILINPSLKSALRKVIANASSYPLFHFFELLDGVANPAGCGEPWLGCTLETKADDDADFLHDDYYDAYWDWRKQRPDPGWKLDTWEE
jgi:hypothetical protein